MNFTKEQFQALSAWEDNFKTAVDAGWARHPGRYNLRVIYDIYTSATGDRRRFDANCQKCATDLLADCGRLYFQDKAARTEVEVSEAVPVKKVKVKVKTTKKGN